MRLGDDKKRKKICSPTKQKVLLFLAAGVALGYRPTLGKQLRIIKELATEWKNVDRDYLRRIVHEFRHERLVSLKEHADGTITVLLTEAGRKRAIRCNIDVMAIPQQEVWDKRWHGVMFDIPEKHKKAREALRLKLRELKFTQYQKSIFIHPYPCRDQIDFIVEVFGVRRYVRYAVFSDLTNEAELRLHYDLV